MIDIACFNKSLKATWIQKYLNSDSEIEPITVLKPQGNLSKNDANNLKITDPFAKEIFENLALFEETIVSDEQFLSLPLWHNSLLRIQNNLYFIRIGFPRV